MSALSLASIFHDRVVRTPAGVQVVKGTVLIHADNRNHAVCTACTTGIIAQLSEDVKVLRNIQASQLTEKLHASTRTIMYRYHIYTVLAWSFPATRNRRCFLHTVYATIDPVEIVAGIQYICAHMPTYRHTLLNSSTSSSGVMKLHAVAGSSQNHAQLGMIANAGSDMYVRPRLTSLQPDHLITLACCTSFTFQRCVTVFLNALPTR